MTPYNRPQRLRDTPIELSSGLVLLEKKVAGTECKAAGKRCPFFTHEFGQHMALERSALSTEQAHVDNPIPVNVLPLLL